MALAVTVEVPLLLIFFSFMLTASVYTNLIIYRTCYVTLGYNKSLCALLGNVDTNETEKLEKLVEPEAATISMVGSTIGSVYTVILCLFIGPWSDRFGRKPVLILNLIGATMSHVGIAIFSYFQNISPWYTIVCSLPFMVTGGAASFITVSLAYITDISNEENRGIRMAIFEAVIGCGFLLGTISSSYLYYATNYVCVFIIAAALCALGLVYTLFIPEPLQNRETEGQVKGFFQVSNVVDMVRTTIKKRQNFNRGIILLTITILTLHIFFVMGDGSLFFPLFERKIRSATSVVGIIGTLGGTYLLHQLLHINEAVLLLLGCFTVTAAALLQGLGNKDWYIYTAGSIRGLSGFISPMARSLVSKLVPEDEIGKVFAMIIASENTLSLASSPLYTALYNATINTDPGLFNYVTASGYLFNIILTIIIIVIQKRKTPSYDTLNNEETNEDDDVTQAIN
ncbi:hypothetical protein NQ318_005449 [Aromia moschata]|uniref:Major facilitator superfamily (MFS) profile domain-containing protein n=1 Tax=Aromia moschata TaxID=1265417 RepID=A0AAV8YWE7_9CUCU|nr:hypothetical protein NQ318_005449 [Aromia moschata]